MKRKNIYLLTIFIVLTICNPAFGRGNDRDIPDSIKHLFHNNIYFRYSQGLNVYLKDVKNGYAGLSGKEIRFGMTVEPEIGTFIRDFMQIGIAYLYLNGVAEDTLDLIKYQSYVYDDIFFSGGVITARYFILNREKIKIPIGIEGIFGKCRLFSGSTSNLDRKRGLQNIDMGYDYEANGFGGGISGSFAYYPFWFMSVGVDAGIRVIRSQDMKERYQGLELPDYEDGSRTLNFSSINLKAFLSLQY